MPSCTPCSLQSSVAHLARYLAYSPFTLWSSPFDSSARANGMKLLSLRTTMPSQIFRSSSSTFETYSLSYSACLLVALRLFFLLNAGDDAATLHVDYLRIPPQRHRQQIPLFHGKFRGLLSRPSAVTPPSQRRPWNGTAPLICEDPFKKLTCLTTVYDMMSLLQDG